MAIFMILSRIGQISPLFSPMFQGRPRVEEPVPSNMSPFSDKVPNTSNRILGSRINTPLGQELMRLDRLMILTCSRRSKPDPEFLPS